MHAYLSREQDPNTRHAKKEQLFTLRTSGRKAPKIYTKKVSYIQVREVTVGNVEMIALTSSTHVI